MSDLIPSSVLLAILQNQIKSAVDENNVDTSNFAKTKHFNSIRNLTQSEKQDISENLYDFLIDDATGSVFFIIVKETDYWKYAKIFSSGDGVVILSAKELKFVQFVVDTTEKDYADDDATFV